MPSPSHSAPRLGLVPHQAGGGWRGGWMEVRRVRPAGGVRLAAEHRDDAPEAHLVLLAASTPEGNMLVNLGPGQSGWATQLVSDRHVLGVRLVEQLWTPPRPRPESCWEGQGERCQGDKGDARGLEARRQGPRGPLVPRHLQGLPLQNPSPLDLRLSLRLFRLWAPQGVRPGWRPPPHPAASQPYCQAHTTSEAPGAPPMTCGLNTECGCRGTKEWAGLDTLIRRPGQQHHQPAANPPSVQAETTD